MMKQTTWMVIAACTVLACNTRKDSNSFHIEGSITNSPAKMVYLQESAAGGGAVILDSAQVNTKGQFQLTGNSKEEAIYTLRTSDNPYPFAVLINDSRNISVKADLANAANPYEISGSKASQGILEFEKVTMEKAKGIYNLSKSIDSMMKAKTPDSLLKQPFSDYESRAAELKSYTGNFVEKASSPMLALYALGSYQRLAEQLGLKGFSTLESADLIRQTSDRFPSHQALADLKKKQRSRQAPDFAMSDTTGKSVSLSSFRGKYVLVDFWASWCGPCRQENPNVVKAFNQFKDKNFTILGVSLDKTREAWMDAIHHDQLTWNHVSDLQYWNNAAASLYDVRSIPYNILVDPNGNIIAEDLRGEDLINKLNAVLK